MTPDERRALEDERAYLLASLDDLDAEYAAGDLADDDYTALKDDYTARAAAVIRRLDGPRRTGGGKAAKKGVGQRRSTKGQKKGVPGAGTAADTAPDDSDAAGASEDGGPSADEGDAVRKTSSRRRGGRRPAAGTNDEPADENADETADETAGEAGVDDGLDDDLGDDRPRAAGGRAGKAKLKRRAVVGPASRAGRDGSSVAGGEFDDDDDEAPFEVPGGSGKPGGRRNLVVAILGTVAFIALAVWMITANTGTRQAGEQATGSVPAMGGQAGATENCALAAGAFARAQCYDKQGRILDALKAYDEVVTADPNNVMAWSQSGWMLVRTNNPELMQKGLDRIDRAIGVDPQFAQAHFFKGSTLQRMGRPAEAVCELRIFMGLVPPGGTEAQMVDPLLKGAMDQAQQNNQPISCQPLPMNPAGNQPASTTTVTGVAPNTTQSLP